MKWHEHVKKLKKLHSHYCSALAVALTLEFISFPIPGIEGASFFELVDSGGPCGKSALHQVGRAGVRGMGAVNEHVWLRARLICVLISATAQIVTAACNACTRACQS